ncbi:uroporphyrinogen-III C-methyltransferase [Poriferisphaera sp. WC338]|uniref:uroporphyrinogen-III C-methyltransferase n=1 Tax=Poriferisphaera sp. WC338 TaxID=3425129 RepID=UPI003D81271C
MSKKICKVFLIGAGPGDPDLITVKAMQLLKKAEVVIFDALANPRLLTKIRSDVERIDASKRGGNHRLTQDQINDLLVEKAQSGRVVVRLKGGDPYLFGRGAEEAIYLAKHGIDCEIVPGVTSGIAAPGAGGIPVTYRKIASTVTFITGHEDPTKDETAIDYQSLAGMIKVGGTACFYMGVGRLQLICDTLTKHGLSEETPIALVQWGTLPKQRMVRGNLQTICDEVQRTGIGSPSMIVIGQVAGIDEAGLNGFMDRPLFGQKIIVTRTRQQASSLRDKLEALGADVIEAPTIEVVPPLDWGEVDEAVRKIGQYDWLVLTSVNGVNALRERLHANQLDARQFSGVKIAAIGDATAKALEEQLCLRADLVPTRYVAESLAGEMITKHGVKGEKVLLLRADIARPALPELLDEAGAKVTEIVAYETKLTEALPTDVVQAIVDGDADWITFTSASTARNMCTLLGDNWSQLISQTAIASIGPITTAVLRDELSTPPTIEAEVSNIQGLVDALVEAAQNR